MPRQLLVSVATFLATFLAIVVALRALPIPAKDIDPASVEFDTDINYNVDREAGVPAQPAAKADAAKADAAKSTDTESPRAKSFAKLTVDRRPSAVLKMMATKVKSSDPPGSEKIPVPAKIRLLVDVFRTESPFARAAFLAALGTTMSLRDPIDVEMEAFHREVTLGNWRKVGDDLRKLPADEAKALYRKILQALSNPAPPPMGIQPQMAQFGEKNAYGVDDLLGLIRSSPAPIDKDGIKLLSAILRQALASGTSIENAARRLKAETEAKSPLPLKNLQIASLLTGAGQAAFAGDFLPTLDKAIADRNDEALDLLAKHCLGRYGIDPKPEMLEKAWTASSAVMSHPKAPRELIDQAIARVVDLAPKVKEKLGQEWLEQSFTKDRQRGREILAAISASVGQGLVHQPHSPDVRVKALRLQKTAVEALLRTIPEGQGKKSDEWRVPLSLLAVGWLNEAEFTQQYGRGGRLGPRIQRDRFGNMFFYDDGDPFYQFQMRQDQNRPQPVEVGDVLEVRPSVAWIDLVDEPLRPKLSMAVTNLFLKGGDEKQAYPYIEKLAQTHPDKARALVHEFLRVWIQNHDLNDNRRNMNPFLFMYGFMSRAEGIPLTRSAQERNLRELAEWIGKIRKLPIGEIDDELLARAFTASHSSAEIFRVELIERVFGPVGGLKPKALGQILQQMRENLATSWREPAVQKDKKTNRKQKDIQIEVMRGYELALATTEDALKKYPTNWELMLAKAALVHDENNYRQEIAKSSEFSAKRRASFDLFAAAAKQYVTTAGTLAENELTSRPFEQWFYASLGACDLGLISEDKQPDSRQPALILKCLKSMPADLAEKHMTKFVNTLVTKLGAVKAPVKYRYLKAGLEIAGDHKFAYEARRTFDYYKDLITEIRLEAEIDGPSQVGHGQPFGVFIHLVHTREIERESGGFSRYLQNQNHNLMFAYNFGRPTTDYRDRFESAVKDALMEQFEVISVTFHNENVNSRAIREYGWRLTPYAYLLIKARGPQVDKIPALKIDLDFLDTAGYVVLPIESAPKPIDARPEAAPTTRVRDLQITQTLDERQANKGKLVLEVKAVGLGLVPDFDSLMTLDAKGFDVAKIDDPGVSVAKFDPDSAEPAIVSERIFSIALEAKPGQEPRSFSFAQSKQEGTKNVYQRYQDADLAPAEAVIDLEERYGEPSRAWIGWTIAGVAAAILAIVGVILWMRRPRTTVAPRFAMPSQITPFSVLALLQAIAESESLSPVERTELESAIRELTARYFSSNGQGSVPLERMAGEWVRRTGRSRTRVRLAGQGNE